MKVSVGEMPQVSWQRGHPHERIAVHGGQRLVNPDSKHFAIIPKNVADWRDQWDLRGIV